MKASVRARTLLAALVLLAVTAAQGGGPRPFHPDTLDKLRAEHVGRPFVVAFWSITCVPCREELPHWGDWQRRHPGVPIVLVATDGPEDHEAVGRVIAAHQMDRVTLYVFADGFAERIRHAVDRRWYGEVPRTYFFDNAHRPLAKSGRLDVAWVEAWLKGEAPAPN